MPMVPGNEPQPQQNNRGVLWLIPLLVVFSRPLATLLNQLTGWSVTPLEIMLAGGAVLVLLWLVSAAGSRNRGQRPPGAPMAPPLPARLPTPSAPPRPLPAPSSSAAMPSAPSRPGLAGSPSPPDFEPYITGKVLLMGCLLLLVFGAVGLLIVLAGSS